MIAATGYALASTGPAPLVGAPRIGCADPTGRLVSVTGRLPRGVSVAYLVSADGSSLEGTVTSSGAYRFVLPKPAAGSPGPVRLEYFDAGARRHEEALPAGSPPGCPERRAGTNVVVRASGRASAVVPGHTPAPGHPSAATTGPGTPVMSAPAAITTRRPGESAGAWAEALDNEATVHVEDAVAGCGTARLVPPPQPTKVTSGSPSSALLGLLGVLRRAPTPAELALKVGSHGLLGPPGSVTVFPRYTRIVHGPDGLVATLVVGRGTVSLPASFLPACQQKINEYLDTLLRGEPHDVGFDAHEYRRDFNIGRLNLGVHAWLSFGVGSSAESGGTGGPVHLEVLRHDGISLAGMTVPGHSGTSLVAGLVPDGVATVTLELPRHISHGSAHALYPHRYVATSRVTDNVFFLPSVPRVPAVAAQGSVVIWRAGDGRTLRRFHGG
jgi:hypothetical protein